MVRVYGVDVSAHAKSWAQSEALALTQEMCERQTPELTLHRAEAAEAYRRVYLGSWLGERRGVTQQYSQFIKAK